VLERITISLEGVKLRTGEGDKRGYLRLGSRRVFLNIAIEAILDAVLDARIKQP